MHKLPNDLLILNNQPLTAVQPIVLSSFQTLDTDKTIGIRQKVYRNKLLGWKKSSLCI